MIALDLFDQGILCVPSTPNPFVPKKPLVPYAHWRTQPPSREEYKAIWEKHPDAAVQILCEGIEAIDLDTKNQDFGQNIIADFETELNALAPGLLNKLFQEQTPSGGRHYVYRVSEPLPSTTLARREDDNGKPATLVDYLAHNKLLRCYPSQGYRVLNGDLLSLYTVTEEERRFLISAALSLNSYQEPQSYGSSDSDQDRPGDRYNAETTIDDMLNLLQAHGWRYLKQHGQYIHLNRPGAKTKGTDAILNIDQKWVYPWSTSTEFPQQKAYDFFGVYSVLEHRGNHSEAAKALWMINNYTPPSAGSSVPTAQSEGFKEEQETILDSIQKDRFSFNKEYDVNWMFYHKDPYNPYDDEQALCAGGQACVVIGPGKSFKSQIAGAIVSSALGRRHETGFRIEMPFERPIIRLFDTEQDNFYFSGSVKRIHWMANINFDIPNFEAYCIKEHDIPTRRKIITAAATLDCGLIVIDGILDCIMDYNDKKEVAIVEQWIMDLLAQGVMLIIVSHTGESKGLREKAIGALGSMLIRKGASFLLCKVQNPDEDDVKLRRILVKPLPGRGTNFKRFEVSSYEKMVYLSGSDIPEHYRNHYMATSKTATTTATDHARSVLPPLDPSIPMPRQEPPDTLSVKVMMDKAGFEFIEELPL